MSDFKEFQNFRDLSVDELKDLKSDVVVNKISQELFKRKYTYNFDWFGLPIIQYPQDMIALQEIIWATKPNVIIETGVARGGSVVFYASLLKLLNNGGRVIGIDIDIRDHNRNAIEAHPMSDIISLVEGSSVEESTLSLVKRKINPEDKVMVILDSNHTHSHVLKELEFYGQLVTKGCYLVVLDTCVEDLPNDLFEDRMWGSGDNPKTAVHEFLRNSQNFVIDQNFNDKLILSSAPDGYLRCIK